MNVVFKKCIIDQIRDARQSALKNDREIDSIELTEAEANRLQREFMHIYSFIGVNNITRVMGIDIKILRSDGTAEKQSSPSRQ